MRDSVRDISALVGLTLRQVHNREDEIVFKVDNGDEYRLHHRQDCCEHVRVEDVTGELQDLVGSPITLAEEVSDYEGPVPEDGYRDSYTWTFYKLATAKGYVTIRFLGESNGYYSEGVDFVKVGEC